MLPFSQEYFYTSQVSVRLLEEVCLGAPSLKRDPVCFLFFIYFFYLRCPWVLTFADSALNVIQEKSHRTCGDASPPTSLRERCPRVVNTVPPQNKKQKQKNKTTSSSDCTQRQDMFKKEMKKALDVYVGG